MNQVDRVRSEHQPQPAAQTTVLVTGATGFVGRELVGHLVKEGHHVVATSRRHRSDEDGVEWRVCDLNQPQTLSDAVRGVTVAYYLAHSMGDGNRDYRAQERRSAEHFLRAAEEAGVKRIVYLGGPAPAGPPSEHLRSRLEVGEALRSGEVSTVELRASMVIGHGSASWQIVRDLALRLPAMVLPRWLRSRTCPVALEDVIVALLAAAHLEMDGSEWFDIPGPEQLTGKMILERVAEARKRSIKMVEVPLLTPELSALWLKLVTRADFSLARELVVGLKQDLIPKDARFWALIGHTQLLGFDEAVHRALAAEKALPNSWERLVQVATSRP